jgi:hypothetical protein
MESVFTGRIFYLLVENMSGAVMIELRVG